MSTKGIPQLERRLQAVAKGPDGRLGDRTMRAWQLRTTTHAKIGAPKRTGHLKQSIHPGRITPTSAQVEVSAPYAPPIEFGHRSFDIRPVHARVLAWGGPRRLSGNLRAGAKPTNFAMRVHIPAAPPRPFLMPAAAKAQAELGPYFQNAVIVAWNNAA